MGRTACTEPQCLYKGALSFHVSYVVLIVIQINEVRFSSVHYFYFINLSGFISETACSSTQLLQLLQEITVSTFRASAHGRSFSAAVEQQAAAD